MPEAVDTHTMNTLLARPLDLLGLQSLPQVQAIAIHAASVFGEAAWLEGCLLLAEDAPVETHEALRQRPPTHFPEIHSVAMERAYRAMPRDEARDLLCEIEQEAVDATLMRDRCDQFRRAPHLFVPGARPAAAVTFLHRSHDLDGWIQLSDGEVLPWLYAPGGVGHSAVADAARYVAGALGVERAVIVGTHVQAGVVLPPELIFVCVVAPIATHNSTGPEAA
ncbi:hypothetical protein FV242_05775 [Methylobacterium sp. WL64]|uniref:hypothetical protein n=1 Tax=Methylobacterium sp. WL64 TaxID=2603894 RepID=UPI0011CB7FF3|nr:hypothetical protein [Methylobacterium sp. WL64]TXN04861.1 hypothetical protein FV242_05775 [Methylobacterium sp. WL64]